MVIEMSDDKKRRCVRCQHMCEGEDEYCCRCGAPLKNKCTNNGGPLGDPCKKVNKPEAAYCAKCGSPTVFNKAGMVNTPYQQSTKVEIEDVDMKQFDHKFFKHDDF